MASCVAIGESTSTTEASPVSHGSACRAGTGVVELVAGQRAPPDPSTPRRYESAGAVATSPQRRPVDARPDRPPHRRARRHRERVVQPPATPVPCIGMPDGGPASSAAASAGSSSCSRVIGTRTGRCGRSRSGRAGGVVAVADRRVDAGGGERVDGPAGGRGREAGRSIGGGRRRRRRRRGLGAVVEATGMGLRAASVRHGGPVLLGPPLPTSRCDSAVRRTRSPSVVEAQRLKGRRAP